MNQRHRLVGAAIPVLAIALAACGSGGGATPGQTINTSTPTPAASLAASPAASPAASEAPSGEATIIAKEVGTRGTILVDGDDGMTVYTFTEDTKDSGTSACTGNCLKTWPAVTVPDGTTPTAGDGVTGTLGTIKRADDGTTQVTYNGLPLYYFINDKAPGDSNGVYDKWEVVKP